jgi:hypothetical protein
VRLTVDPLLAALDLHFAAHNRYLPNCVLLGGTDPLLQDVIMTSELMEIHEVSQGHLGKGGLQTEVVGTHQLVSARRHPEH